MRKAQPAWLGLFVSTEILLAADFRQAVPDSLLQCIDEALILVWSSYGDADRGGCSPASGERTNDDAFLLQLLADE